MPTWQRVIPIATATAVIAMAVATDALFSACGGSVRYVDQSRLPPAVTISAAGVKPAELAVPLGAVVKFVNVDTEVHDIRSNPHPAHTECSTLSVGGIQPSWGALTSITDPSRRGLTCGYHDETRPDDVRFQGTIVIR